MNLSILEIIILFLCLISCGVVFIFFKRKNLPENHYRTLIDNLNRQKTIDLEIIEKGNKEINALENEILKCKKQLHWRIFK